ncbi:hypothetical protein IAR55_005629 [Kwoniella newhampshirensis]|uniref:Beta-glucuronidase C-terminal domain-containing protein n=1 Tax=Kwoniella newhampshirensis TaxID=1651941 RepID=A0AAW0YFZ2_9TREE
MLSTVTLFTLLGALSSTASAAVITRAANPTFDLTTGAQTAIKDPAPVALSLEFFAFPGYVGLSATEQCLTNLDNAAGAPTRVRIGGTTQDRATFSPSLTSAVNYTVPSAGAAPATLNYGPSPTTIGLNRRLANLNNSIVAAQQAVAKMDNLYAFELGNEPHLYVSSDPIAGGKSWTPALDAQIQVSWQKSVSAALGKTNIIQGGVFLQPPKFSIQELGPVEQNAGTLNYVKSWADHSYPQSACGGSRTNLQTLQNHSNIVSYVATFQPEVNAANSYGPKPLFFGETNSATCGGGGISPTYGAALWIVDYVLQSVKLGYQRLHFHQGTIGNSPYSWWGQNNVFAPYYGAYFAASAIQGMSSIAQVDDGKSTLGVYSLYAGFRLSRSVVYNSAYFANSTTTGRPSQTVVLTGIPSGSTSVRTKRLTAPYSTSQQELGQNPTFGGQSFANGTCLAQGVENFESVKMTNGQATVSVGASEALLVYID